MYYLISLKHTNKGDQFITLWRPDNAGYCYSKTMAGIYTTVEKDYHDTENTLPVKVEDCDKLFVNTVYDTMWQLLIPNNKKSWSALGLELKGKQLVRSLQNTSIK